MYCSFSGYKLHYPDLSKKSCCTYYLMGINDLRQKLWTIWLFYIKMLLCTTTIDQNIIKNQTFLLPKIV
jgi:hypothetical protein